MIAKETFTLTQEAFKLNFEGYGFKLCVPKNSLPAEVSETQLSVQVSLSGPFLMPSNCELVSAVYWVSSPHKFIPSAPRRNFLTSSKRKLEESSLPTVPMAAYLYPTFLG